MGGETPPPKDLSKLLPTTRPIQRGENGIVFQKTHLDLSIFGDRKI